ncbi:MAG: DinB family protein [Gemmatimonadaceae bacterium]
MKIGIYTAALVALAIAPRIAASQQATMAATSANPVSDAFRDYAKSSEKNLIAAAEAFSADKYGYKPTPAQMSVGDIVVHLSQGNDYLCGAIGGMKAPQRTTVAATESKEALVARLRETFAFCDQALASVTDATMGEQLPFFGGRKMTRAAIMTLTTGDWADHYSQYANYLRLNGMLPPTANRSAGQ